MDVAVYSSLGWLSWIIFGALAGWVAHLLVGRGGNEGCLTNIVVGIVGAFIGGLIWNVLLKTPVLFQWSLGSFVIAVIGAVVLLVILRALRR